MTAARVLVAGPVTRDRVVAADGTAVEAPGGTAVHAGAVHARMGTATRVLTRMAGRDRRELLAPLHDAGARVRVEPSPATTRFIHTKGEAPRVPRRAAPLQAGDLAEAREPAIHLGPLVRGDLDTATLRAARARCSWLALDAQGLTRRVAAGRVRACGADPAWLEPVDVLKATGEEARLLTGYRDPRHAARHLQRACGGEALVTLGGDGAVLALADGVRAIEAVAPPGPIANPVGCGDAFLAAYLTRRLAGDGARRAATAAARVAAVAATRPGALDIAPDGHAAA